MSEIALREASDAELAAIFRARAEHVIGTVDSIPVVFVRFQTIDGRRWGSINMLSGIDAAIVPRMFYALKRRLRQEHEPIYALAQSETSPRLLRLIGLEPTDEFSVGKRVWVWTPA